MIIKIPKIYTAFCLIMLLSVFLLSRFKGELYLSPNGYLLFKRSIGGSNNDALNPETRRTETSTFEMKINGDLIYWMTWWDDFEIERINGYSVERFFTLSEDYGLTEFYAWRSPEKLNYKIINNIYIKQNLKFPLQYCKNMDILAEYMAASFWYPEGYRIIESYNSINEGRTKITYLSFGLLLFLQCLSFWFLFTRWREGQKYDTIKKCSCQFVFGIFQLLVLWMDLSKYLFFLP